MALNVLYQGGLWFSKAEAMLASSSGLNFLKCYGHLVDCTLRVNRDRFPLLPKLHYIMHLFLSLQEQSLKAEWSLNLVASTVQADEDTSLDSVFVLGSCYIVSFFVCFFKYAIKDFVGHNARHARRVGSQYVPLRTLQRYLVHAAEAMKA